MVSWCLCSYFASKESFFVEIERQNAYATLNLNEECSTEDLKKTYVQLVRHYHPDTGGEQADVHKLQVCLSPPFNNVKKYFQEVQNAYKTILDSEYSAEEQQNIETEVNKLVFDIRHTAPQHRQVRLWFCLLLLNSRHLCSTLSMAVTVLARHRSACVNTRSTVSPMHRLPPATICTISFSMR